MTIAAHEPIIVAVFDSEVLARRAAMVLRAQKRPPSIVREPAPVARPVPRTSLARIAVLLFVVGGIVGSFFGSMYGLANGSSVDDIMLVGLVAAHAFALVGLVSGLAIRRWLESPRTRPLPVPAPRIGTLYVRAPEGADAAVRAALRRAGAICVRDEHPEPAISRS